MFGSKPRTLQRRTLRALVASIGFFAIAGGSVALAAGGQSVFSNGGPVLAPLGSGYGLTGFRFNFKGGDHHIREITVGLDCLALAPGCPEDAWVANYRDNSNRAYWIDVGWEDLPAGTIYGKGSLDVSAHSFWQVVTLGPATPGTVPVLTGFSVENVGDDMHLKTLIIYMATEDTAQYDPNYVQAVVYFADNTPSNESPKRYTVSYAEVPADHVRWRDEASGHLNGKEVSGSVNGAEHPVLQAFSMENTSGDSHVDRIGAQVGAGGWRITFDDGNLPFDYWIRWAEISP